MARLQPGCAQLQQKDEALIVMYSRAAPLQHHCPNPVLRLQRGGILQGSLGWQPLLPGLVHNPDCLPRPKAADVQPSDTSWQWVHIYV